MEEKSAFAGIGEFLMYLTNAAIVMACLGAIIFTAMQPEIDSSVIAVVSGAAGTIAGSVMTIMLKTTGAEDEFEDPMHEVAMTLLKNQAEHITVKDGKVFITRGDKVTEIDDPSVEEKDNA